MELKVVKYRNIGIVEDNYVENDYWDEHKFCGFELNNGKCIVLINTTNNFGDDCNGGETDCYYIDSLDKKFEKSFLWKDEEVDNTEEQIIIDFYEENELEYEDETEIITVNP